MPSFLNPLAALLAAGIVIPTLVALYFLKLRRKPEPVASTILWKRTLQDLQVNAPFQKLRRNLLLLLQLLVLVALLLAFARPTVTDTAPPGDSLVLLIDRSASMSASDGSAGARADADDATTRLAEAKRRASDLVANMNDNARGSLIVFDGSARTVVPFTTDKRQLQNAIDAVTPSNRPTFASVAYQLADAGMAYDPAQLRPGETAVADVHLFSDGRLTDAQDVRLRSLLTFQRVGRAETSNVAVVALDARRNYERPTQVQVFARLANYGPEPVEVDVRLSVATFVETEPGSQRFEVQPAFEALTLPPERWSADELAAARADGLEPRTSVAFTFELTTAATIRLEQTRADALPADDLAFVFVPPPKPLSVLLVTEGNYWLEQLLPALELNNPQVMTPAQYRQQMPADFDLIIFDAFSPAALPPAGNFMYFGAVPPDSSLTQVTDAAGLPQFIEETMVLDWDRDHPILRGLSLDRLYAQELMLLAVPPEGRVLVDGLRGPMAVELRDARGVHLVFAFDLLKTNWPTTSPLNVSFPAAMYNAVQYMAIGSSMDVRPTYRPGQTLSIPRANVERAFAAGTGRAGVEPGATLTLISPDGREQNVPVPPSGEVVLGPLELVGVYQTRPVIPQFERLCVNLLDENESNLLPVPTPPGGVGQAVVTAEEAPERRQELWWWLVVAAGAVLMVEWLVYARRLHL